MARRSISVIGSMKNGQMSGPFWIGLPNGGFLHGFADEETGLATGNEIAFIYPDGVTALKGKFEHKVMKNAKHFEIINYAYDSNGILVADKFTRALSNDSFFFDPPSTLDYGGGYNEGFVPDPFEMKNVKLAESRVIKGGEGVVAIKDLPKGQLVAYFSLHLHKTEAEIQAYRANCLYNQTRSMDERRACTKYSLPMVNWLGTMDLAPEHDKNPLPNFGPKINHHFSQFNVGFKEAEHPRWGLIMSVTALRDIQAGDELFADYGYEKMAAPNDFPWYWQLYEEHQKRSHQIDEL